MRGMLIYYFTLARGLFTFLYASRINDMDYMLVFPILIFSVNSVKIGLYLPILVICVHVYSLTGMRDLQFNAGSERVTREVVLWRHTLVDFPSPCEGRPTV